MLQLQLVKRSKKWSFVAYHAELSTKAAAACPITGQQSSGSKSNSSVKLSYKDLPGPPVYPIVRNYPFFAQNGGDPNNFIPYYRNVYKKYGMICYQDLFVGPEVLVFDPREYLLGLLVSYKHHHFFNIKFYFISLS